MMAYGQTSAGKTFTLFGDGTKERQGIIPSFVEFLFSKKSERDLLADDKLNVSLQLFEIYKERIKDLLDPASSKKLSLREDKRFETYIDNLHSEDFYNSETLLHNLESALNFRHTGRTMMNEESSRSHVVCVINISLLPQL